ncbi:MAG TPA: hypothetical protein VGH28_03325 [Polyangiaceae bacterium]|jgi:hypothetical protein
MKTLLAFALLACAACSESTADAPIVAAGMDRGPAVSDDAPAARAHVALDREPAWREPAMHPHIVHREGDWVVCAQCR